MYTLLIFIFSHNPKSNESIKNSASGKKSFMTEHNETFEKLELDANPT